MGTFLYDLDDEVFNKVTRAVGAVINIKEINGQQYLRINLWQGAPDEIWPASECELWHKKKLP
jgi:hypothetical protein